MKISSLLLIKRRSQVIMLILIQLIANPSAVYAESIYIEKDRYVDLGNGNGIDILDKNRSFNFTLFYNSTTSIPDAIPSYNRELYGEPRSVVITLQSDLDQQISFGLFLTYTRRNINDDKSQLNVLFWNSSIHNWKSIAFTVSDNPVSFSYIVTSSFFPQNINNQKYAYVITSKESLEVVPIWKTWYGAWILLIFLIVAIAIYYIIKKLRFIILSRNSG